MARPRAIDKGRADRFDRANQHDIGVLDAAVFEFLSALIRAAADDFIVSWPITMSIVGIGQPPTTEAPPAPPGV